MQVYAENATTVERLWVRLNARIDAYPPALRQLGQRFLSWAGPGYFSMPDAAPLLHLPIWLGRDVPPDTLDDILEATALAYAYVRIQDNVIDEPEGRGHPPFLLLGNALLWDAMSGFRKHGNDSFWERSRRAWLDFSEFTELERRQLQTDDRYTHADFVAHARKCALAEVPLYAVMSARGDWAGAEAVPRLVHALARSYGCVNDVMGHVRDLESGAKTYLWSEVRASATRGTPGATAPPELLRAELASGGVMDSLLAEAAATLNDARVAAAELEIPTFDRFADQRAARIAELQLRLAFVRLTSAFSA
ncbi:hypothetical protein LBMAG42_48490 [Deltaproteobacteria bacterium]|nr:hypothetical protein LBMAG42_48490 [Deltaproteobacteria bacterium]